MKELTNKYNLKNLLLPLVVSLVFLGFLTFQIQPKPVSDNGISRLGGIISIARFNEFNIDQTIQHVTGDKVEYNGKFYSSKPPVLHTVLGYVIKVGFQIKPALLQNDIPIYKAAVFLSSVIPLFLSFWLFLYLISDKLKELNFKNIFFSFFLVSGTLLFSYSAYLNNHILEAFFQIILLVLLIKKDLIYNRKLYYLFLGLVLSLLFVIDVTYGFVVIPLTLVFLFLKNRKELLNNLFFLMLGSLPFLFFHFYLRWSQLETIFPPQLFPEKYFSYKGSEWVGTNVNVNTKVHSLPVRAFNYVIGTHGFYLYQPLLLLVFFSKKILKSALGVYVLSITFFYILFNILLQPDYFGSAFGPRRFLPLIPINYYLVVLFLKDRWKQFSTGIKFIIILLFLLTLAISVVGYTNPWTNWDLYPNDPNNSLRFPLVFSIKELFF